MRKKTGGFTLIELLVVVAILALLTTVTFAYLSNSKRRAKDTIRVADIQQIRKATEIYVNDSFMLPPPAGGELCYRSDNGPEWTTLASIIGISLPFDPENLAGYRYAFFRTDVGVGCDKEPNCAWVMTRRQEDEYLVILPVYSGVYTEAQMGATWIDDCGGTAYSGVEVFY